MSKHNKIVYVTLTCLLIVIMLTAFNVYVSMTKELETSQDPPASLDFNNQVVTVNVNSDQTQRSKVDLNNATKEQLKQLPHIGDVLADRIIEARPFYVVDQLKDVKGIGDTIYENIRGLVEIVGDD